MSIAASFFGIVMATIFVVIFSSSCTQLKTCPCGSSNRNYTQCIDSLDKMYACENWAQCQTCRSNTTYCVTCPPRYFGANCTQVVKKPVRRKRQSSSDRCSAPGSISNGYRRLTNGVPSRSRTFSRGDTFRYFCNQGFVMRGNSELTCLTSGQWSNSPPRCSEIAPTVFCSDPGRISDGSYRNSAGNSATSQPYATGDSVIYYCDYGYDLVGNREISCMSSGSWQDKPSCSRVTRDTPVSGRQPPVTSGDCPDPGSIDNGYRRVSNGVSPNSRTFGTGISLRYFCNQGFRLQGSNVLTCSPSGAWSSSLPWCSERGSVPVDRPRLCPNPTTDSNTEIESISPDNGQSSQGYQAGSEVRFRCRRGYELYGTNPIRCLSNGQWENDPPTCRTTTQSTDGLCRDPGPIQHGGVIVYKSSSISSRQSASQRTSNIEHPIGTRLRYNCSSGFRLEGETNLYCVSPGRWSAEKPSCIEDCGLSLLSAGGKITNGKNTTAGEFPWIVFIYINETQSTCGGVLLDHRTVLSAAHCFEGAGYCTLYFGKYNRSDAEDDRHVQTRQSSEIIMHPDFDISTFNNDIAIVKFSRDVPYSPRIQPICMPTPSSTAANVVPGELGYLTGWGQNENQVRSLKLMLANLPVQDPNICMAAYQRRNLPINITPGKYCVGFKDHRDINRIVNACRGDSGSPMVFYNNDTKRFTVEGLVSFGMSGNCDQPEKYTMFTKVNYYLRWIFQNS